MILALDFETSGKTPGVNQAVSLGVAVMDGSKVVESREWLIGPKRHYKTGQIERVYDVVALSVSCIPWKDIQTAAEPSMVCGELFDWAYDKGARDMPIVAFNASFDFSFYSDLLFIGGGFDHQKKEYRPAAPALLGSWTCAMLKARAALLDLPNFKLDTVAGHYGLSRTTGRHGALEDAILAGLIHDKLTAPVEAA